MANLAPVVVNMKSGSTSSLINVQGASAEHGEFRDWCCGPGFAGSAPSNHTETATITGEWHATGLAGLDSAAMR